MNKAERQPNKFPQPQFLGVIGVLNSQGSDSILFFPKIILPKTSSSLDTGLGKHSISYEGNGPLTFPIYKSNRRSAALQLCGWGFDSTGRDLNATLLESLPSF